MASSTGAWRMASSTDAWRMEMIFPILLRIIFVESKRTRGASRYELCTLDPNVPATLLLHKLFFLISSPFGHTSPLQGTFWAPPLYHLYHSLTISEYDTQASFQRRPLEIRFSVGINSPERTIYLGPWFQGVQRSTYTSLVL